MGKNVRYEVTLNYGDAKVQDDGKARHMATGWGNLTEERMLSTVKAVSATMKDNDELIITRSKRD